MRTDAGSNPMTWLMSGSIVIHNASSVLSTFKPGTARVVRFAGPHTLVRAAGWDAQGKLASAYGSWWADEFELAKLGARINQFEGWLPKELLQKAWPAQYRGAAALCEDWNDMREMFKLALPVGVELFGLAGIAAPQTQRSTMNSSKRTTPMLAGGGEQIFFKRSSHLNSINPLWVVPTVLW